MQETDEPYLNTMELDNETQQGLPGSEDTTTYTRVLQDPEMLLSDHSGQLWRLPIEPIHAQKYSELTTTHGLTNPKILQYHHGCWSIAKAWQTTDSKAWLPENLRKDSPYSFALLHNLTLFARRTAGRRKHAHEILTQVWLERQTQDLSFDHSDELKLKFTPLPKKWQLEGPEPDAQECLDGLCSVDLAGAMKIAKDELEEARLWILVGMTAEAADAEFGDDMELLDDMALKGLRKAARKQKKKRAATMAAVSGKSRVQKKKKTAKKKVKMTGKPGTANVSGKKAINRADATGLKKSGGGVDGDVTVGPSFTLPIRGL